MYRRLNQVHFVGIGGSGMSGIAEVLLNLGWKVTGSDLRRSEVTDRLAVLGARVAVGHAAGNLAGAEVVVVSSAIASANPEVEEARARGVPVIPRAEMLAELMRLKHGIAVAGTHGKTTTTSMIATVLAEAGLDPTAVVGGRLNSLGTNAKLGTGEFMVVEADESDGSFLKLSPSVVVVTNVDPEHLDHYGTFERLKETFLEFIDSVPFYGAAVLCLDHPTLQELLPRVRRRTISYGTTPQADLQARRVEFHRAESRFEVFERGRRLARLAIQAPGLHNVRNALASLAVALEVGVGLDAAVRGLEAFGGVDRRFTLRGEIGGVMVFDDYGHHPEEIKATLAAAKGGWGRRLVVAFQPHRFSRTRDLLDEFGGAFHDADLLFVTEVYPAGERPIPGATGEALAREVRAHGHRGVEYVASRADLAARLAEAARPGDLLLTLGAGDITRTAGELIDLLRRRGGTTLKAVHETPGGEGGKDHER